MRFILLLLCTLLSQSGFAEEQLWTDIELAYKFRPDNSKQLATHTARKMRLDFSTMKRSLTTASKNSDSNQIITLPTPDGAFLNFQAEKTTVMPAELSARYPQIQTWKITSLDNPEITGRIDIGERGFHGLFHTADGDRVFIDPVHQSGSVQTETYTVLSNRANHGSADTGFTCELHGDISHSPLSSLAAKTLNNPADDMRTYRLAIATTGEYTQLFGGTKAYALSGITTTVNRLNQVFERDLNIHLELIAENDKLLFLSPSADPYSNQDAANMVEENMVSMDALIGSENYDIGHVLGTGNTGGLAFLNSACGDNKAGGVTGSNSPEGDAFNIDYVAHEIGHQLGARHTFNGYNQNCSANNRAPNSAIEPGSGSSIMGYAGICGNDNLQSHSDAFFHSHSIAQIKHFTSQASGANCGTLTPSLNNNPDVDAGKNYTIPAQTPFVLSGYSYDIDGDPLLHSWEQTDIGTAADLYSDLINNPLFRAWKPTTKKKRYFPKLRDLLNNQSTLGELLPLTNRQLNFSLLVRDNKGGLATDAVTLEVIATGSAFAITSQSIPKTLAARQSFSLDWNVADTDKAPINCQSVDIGLIDANAHYLSLIKNSANDGSETIKIPLDVRRIDNASFKVACSDNIFFAVSSTKHSVEAGKPVLSLNPPSIVKDISGNNALAYTIKISEPAPEEIFIHFEAIHTAGVNASRNAGFTGDAVIAKGKTFTTIKIPVDEVTVEDAISAMKLVIDKPENAQFETEGSQMMVQTLEAVANPEIIASVPSAGGGGSFGLLLNLFLVFLALAKPMLSHPRNRPLTNALTP